MTRWGRKTVRGQVWYPCTACGETGRVLNRIYVRVKGIHRPRTLSSPCGTCKGKKGKWI